MAEPIKTVKKSLLRKSDTEFNSDYGKLPPQVKDLEEAVLAAIMIEKNSISDIVSFLKAEHFYVDAHIRIFRACYNLYIQSLPIDLLTVTQQLRQSGELDASGGPFYITQLTNKIGSAANIEYHARLIKEMWIKRELISQSNEIIRKAYEDEGDVHDILDEAGFKLDQINAEVTSGHFLDYADTMNGQINEIAKAAQNPAPKKAVLGHPTGIYSLDLKISGFNGPDLIIGAARPGEGKTSFALQAADQMLSQGIPLGFISIEMTLAQLNLKLLSLNTGVPVTRLRTKNVSKAELEKILSARDRILKYPLQVHDKPCDPDDIKTIMKGWINKFGVQMGIVDYIQRIKIPKYVRGQGSDAQLTVVSNALKDICLKHEIPVLALSQMSREVENRTGEKARPQLTDLRGSGALEQDADIVIFIYRPEMHKIDKYADGSSTKGVTEFIIEKQRLGSTGTIKAKFNGATGRFDDSEFSDFNKEQLGDTIGEQANLIFTDDDLPF